MSLLYNTERDCCDCCSLGGNSTSRKWKILRFPDVSHKSKCPHVEMQSHVQSLKFTESFRLENISKVIESNHSPALPPLTHGPRTTSTQLLNLPRQPHHCPGQMCQSLTTLSKKKLFLNVPSTTWDHISTREEATVQERNKQQTINYCWMRWALHTLNFLW